MPKRLSVKELWLTIAGLADQGLVSLGSFLTHIVLARSLAPKDYGIFALIYGALIFLNVVHWALVAYPLSVSGASATPDSLRKIISSSLLITVGLAIALSLIAGGVGFTFGGARLAGWVMIALVCWQLQETLRRGLMAHLLHQNAIWGDTISYLGQSGILWYLA